MKHLSKSIFTVGAAFVALCAVAGHDLPINGDFYGVPSGKHIVPGWSLNSRRGARLFPVKHGKQMLELAASPAAPKIAFSELQPAGPSFLEVDAEVSGTGSASLGFEAYDATRTKLLQSGKQPWALTGISTEIKFNFQLTDPNIAFVRILLIAEPGSVARFYDVDAELKYGAAPVPPPQVAPVPPPAPVPAPAARQTLMHEGFYALESLAPVTEFQVAVPAGRDVDFKLGEHPSRGQYWSLAGSYDARICRIEMKHKRKGYSYAKIELNAMYRGTTTVEFVNPAGKRVIVHFTSL